VHLFIWQLTVIFFRFVVWQWNYRKFLLRWNGGHVLVYGAMELVVVATKECLLRW